MKKRTQRGYWKHWISEVKFWNRWKMECPPEDWTPFGFQVRWIDHTKYLYALCCFGLEIRIFINREYTEYPDHWEKIECPECSAVQWANVEHTLPWWSYVHECEKCDYVIMESEWNEVKTKRK